MPSVSYITRDILADKVYKRYKKGNLFQIDFGSGYGYIQEAGEVSTGEFKDYFCIVYERLFPDGIDNIKELSDEKYFVCLFCESPSKTIKKSFDTDQGDPYHPIGKTPRGLEFEYDINSYIYVKRPGRYKVPNDTELPQYLRDDDYDFIAGTYRWFVTTPYKFVKYQKTVKGIEHMPPYLFSFGRCARWWEEGLTLETWNDEYCIRVIEQRYSKNPEERPVKTSFNEVVATIPTEKWIENSDDERRTERISGIDKPLRQFITIMSAEKITLGRTKKAVTELCLELNKLQSGEFFIETREREDLCKFITDLLRSRKMTSAVETLEEYRDW